MVSKPPVAGGEQHPQAKLSWAAVRAIRQRYLAGETQPELAAAHGVTPQNIYAIVQYRSWWPDPSAPTTARPAPVDHRSRPRSVQSPRPPNGHLTWAQVRAIRARFHHEPVTVRELAAEHHVSRATIQTVVAFKSYWPEPGAERTPRPAPLPSRRPPSPRGEQAGGARLSWAQVRAIRARHAAGGISLGQLAREHGMNVSTVSRIVHRQLWWPDPGDNAARP